IFKDSSIRFLLPIEDSEKLESDETSFFLAIADRRLAIFRLREEGTCGAKYDFNDEIIDHGKITEVWMGKLEKKKIFRLRLTIPLIFRFDGLRIIEFMIEYDEEEKKLPFSEKVEKSVLKDGDRELRFCLQLGAKKFLCIFDDTVVKSDGRVIRNGEISSKMRHRVVAVGKELWHGKVLM
ncbi:hypothetical protein PENTCL1PPCAC_20054, partial [Pristionchus entomophagus]